MNQALENLKKLKNVYQEHLEIEVGEDLKLKLKLLTSDEETQVHLYGMNFEQGVSYLYAVKRDTICRAIVAMNGVEIPAFVEETGADGTPEKLERYLWLRNNIVEGWSQILVDEIWAKYVKLIEKVESKITIKTDAEEEVKEEVEEGFTEIKTEEDVNEQ